MPDMPAFWTGANESSFLNASIKPCKLVRDDTVADALVEEVDGVVNASVVELGTDVAAARSRSAPHFIFIRVISIIVRLVLSCILNS